MKVFLECTYCGFNWEKSVFNKDMLESESCSRCGDYSLKVRSTDNNKIDYYKGSPEFVKSDKIDNNEDENDPLFPWNSRFDTEFGGID